MNDGASAGPDATTLYVDRLSSRNIDWILRAGVSEVVLLDGADNRQRRCIEVLRRSGIAVEEATFVAGQLKDGRGESVYLAARKLAGDLALEASAELIEAQPLLRRLNAEYGREILRLSLAKSLRNDANDRLVRAMTAEALCASGKAWVCLADAITFNGALLEKYVPGVRLHRYPSRRFGRLAVAKELLRNGARWMKRYWSPGPLIPRVPANEPSVLALQEDNIRADRTLRGQPHWISREEATPPFRTYIANLLPIFEVAEDAGHLVNSRVDLVRGGTIRAAWRARRAVGALQKIPSTRRAVLRAAFCERNSARAAALVHINRLLAEAEWMGCIAAWLNSRVFLIRETYMLSADALQVVAKDLHVTTIAYQYSNLGFPSLNLMSAADVFVVFAPMFSSVFRAEGIAPKSWVSGGYLYDGIAALVRNRAREYRDTLLAKGARFVVCYFDESVQDDRWGLISKEEHLEELHVLVKAILSDARLGVVVKSQFMRNSPSRLYPEDSLIREAKATGRYVELIHGNHRNDIYPTEAALIADLCIGHKFGATASLEAAIAGVRSVLLNQQGARTSWDHLYAKANIEFGSIESLMRAISEYRNGEDTNRDLGDWSSILDNFDEFRNGKAASRLREIVERSINSHRDIAQCHNELEGA